MEVGASLCICARADRHAASRASDSTLQRLTRRAATMWRRDCAERFIVF